jgi:hypothetical protein
MKERDIYEHTVLHTIPDPGDVETNKAHHLAAFDAGYEFCQRLTAIEDMRVQVLVWQGHGLSFMAGISAYRKEHPVEPTTEKPQAPAQILDFPQKKG